MAIDVRTLFFSAAILTTFLGLALLYYGRNHKTYPGFNFWTAGILAAALSYDAAFLRGLIPEWLSIMLVNCAAVLSGLFRLDGIMRFMRGNALGRRYYAVTVIAIAIAGYFYFIRDDMTVRLQFLTVWVCVFTWWIAWVLIRSATATGKSLCYIAAGINIVYGLTMVGRTLCWTGHANGLFDNSIYNSLFFTSVMVYELWLGLLIMMMNNQRTDRELRTSEGMLRDHVARLENAMSEVKVLKGLLPICCSCKRIRDDKGYWTQLESYIDEHSEARFTHGYCPECALATSKEIEGWRQPVGGGPRPPADK